MQFNEVKEEIKRIGFKNMDTDSDNLFEAIVVKDKIGTIRSKLEGFFGSPAWPSPKTKLSLQMEKLIRQYGGIMQGQTLYMENKDKEVVFAMLWPWKDGEHTTLKLIQNSLGQDSNTGLNEISY